MQKSRVLQFPNPAIRRITKAAEHARQGHFEARLASAALGAEVVLDRIRLLKEADADEAHTKTINAMLARQLEIALMLEQIENA